MRGGFRDVVRAEVRHAKDNSQESKEALRSAKNSERTIKKKVSVSGHRPALGVFTPEDQVSVHVSSETFAALKEQAASSAATHSSRIPLPEALWERL